MKTHRYFVYLLASQSRALYVGVTHNLERRINEHKQKLIPGFTSDYNISRLVYFEEFGDIRDAIAREKQIKSYRREKKIALIEKESPPWDDLAASWFPEERAESEAA